MNIGYNPHLGYEIDVLIDYKNVVHSIAQKFRGSLNAGIGYEDLISVGNMGLIQAFRNYNPDRFNGKVTSFLTYAYPMIKWSIQKFVQEKRHSVKVPRRIQENAITILKQGWSDESVETIVAMSGWKSKAVEEAKQFLNGYSVASLDNQASNKNDDEIALIDLLPCHTDFTTIDVQEFISYLSRKEKEVLKGKLEGLKQAEISDKTGISTTHISRILTQIGTKYYEFQAGTLEKKEEKIVMVRPLKQKTHLKENPINGIEWFVDEVVSTTPTVGLNNQGIHFNLRTVHETGWKPGQCVRVGLVEDKLIFQSATNGIVLRRTKSDTNGALRIVNKRLVEWLRSKGVSLKRYALQEDQNGFYYISIECQS